MRDSSLAKPKRRRPIKEFTPDQRATAQRRIAGVLRCCPGGRLELPWQCDSLHDALGFLTNYVTPKVVAHGLPTKKFVRRLLLAEELQGMEKRNELSLEGRAWVLSPALFDTRLSTPPDMATPPGGSSSPNKKERRPKRRAPQSAVAG